MMVNPGDIVVGDQDGLLAFRAGRGDRCHREGIEAAAQAEEATMAAIREGRWDRSFVDGLDARCNN